MDSIVVWHPIVVRRPIVGWHPIALWHSKAGAIMNGACPTTKGLSYNLIAVWL